MKLFLISMLISVFASASAIVGSVENLIGVVKVKSENTIKKTKVKIGSEIQAGDLLSTSRKASAVIKLSDGSRVVLDSSSSIYFKSIAHAEQLDGKIYYKITSRDAKNSLKVRTPFAIIGIKGTTFVVNTEHPAVTLKEGLIGVSSIKEEFNLYRKKVEEEFNKFKSQQMSEFEKFKNQQNKYAPPVKTKQFDLKAGNRISFAKGRVNEDAWSQDDDAEFAHFESLMKQETKSLIDADIQACDVKTKQVDNVKARIKKYDRSIDAEATEDEWSSDDDKELYFIESQARQVM